MNKKTTAASEQIASMVESILVELGENPGREGLRRTPERVDASLRFLTRGYHLDIDKIINGTIFDAEYDEMVIVKDIEVYSLCEHHMLPFYGKCHIAYLPQAKIIGLLAATHRRRFRATFAGSGKVDHTGRFSP
jgi:GTP cyclohydrolase I